MKYGWWVVGILLVTGCASMSVPLVEEEEGISIQLPYVRAFEKVRDLLESQGYTIGLADKRSGIIETVPQRVGDEKGMIHHNVLFSFLLRGDRSETTVYLRVIVTSDDPDERKKIIDSIKGLSP